MVLLNAIRRWADSGVILAAIQALAVAGEHVPLFRTYMRGKDGVVHEPLRGCPTYHSAIIAGWNGRFIRQQKVMNDATDLNQLKSVNADCLT